LLNAEFDTMSAASVAANLRFIFISSSETVSPHAKERISSRPRAATSIPGTMHALAFLMSSVGNRRDSRHLNLAYPVNALTHNM